MLTLWSVARSPLVLGANLTLLDDTTRDLLTNRDVLAVNQKTTASREALHAGGVIGWTADLPAGFPGGYTTALAIFNTADEATTVNSQFAAYGLDGKAFAVKDAWSGKPLGKMASVKELQLAAHGCALWLLK